METITLVDSPLDHVYGTGWPYRLGDFLFLSGRFAFVVLWTAGWRYGRS